MTPAVEALERSGVTFRIHEYDHRPAATDCGREAADALGVDERRVFKTLVVLADERPAVTVVPVGRRLALKAAAKALGSKRVTMCAPDAAERLTGYVVGGISPFGHRRRLPALVDESALAFATVYVSGGRRGLEIELSPADLLVATAATTAPLTTR